jgi:hypothetical protein
MGLLKTAAKVGVASAVHGRVQRRQQLRWAAQDQAAAPSGAPAPAPAPVPVHAAPPLPPPAAPAQAGSTIDQQLAQLKQLGDLRDAGILTPAEFDAKKAVILGL